MKKPPALPLAATRAACAVVAAVASAAWAGSAWAAPTAQTTLSPAAWQAAAERAVALASEAASAVAPPQARITAQPGRLDPRLRLAACGDIQPYLVSGAPAWGRTRVGLRCQQPGVRWNVFLPVTVQVLAPALQLREALPVGARLAASQLTLAEVDWAAAASPPLADAEGLADRVLARAVAAGQTLRAADLQPRRWFAIGDTVRVVAAGRGFSISAEGQALTPGLEDQPVRVRVEGGRVLTGRAVGERRVELVL